MFARGRRGWKEGRKEKKGKKGTVRAKDVCS